jgi:hypothetical protein
MQNSSLRQGKAFAGQAGADALGMEANMKFRMTIVCVCAALAAMSATCRAQSAPTPAANTTLIPEKARTADYSALASLPDWSGIWTLDFPKRGDAPPEQPSLTPTAAARLKVLEAEEAKNEEPPTESANCVPPGMPQIMFQPYDVEFLFTPGRVTIIQEAYMQVRRVFTDGRGHPADLDPTFNGNSIGHWEGDTLVIDTVGLGHELPLGFNRLNHGPNLHVVERIRLTSPESMEDRMTLTDPDVLAKPWHTVHTFTRHRELDQLEFICEENNRNPVDEKTGQVSTILGNKH